MLIPYRVMHQKELEMKEQTIKHSEKLAEHANEDKKYWREAYFTKNPKRNGK